SVVAKSCSSWGICYPNESPREAPEMALFSFYGPERPILSRMFSELFRFFSIFSAKTSAIPSAFHIFAA
ncbi:MAG: hypothetical protein MJY60_04025, partial [Bacteroidales bacterium]|nr:hypothetical protein [Bacteroidales bacterium]